MVAVKRFRREGLKFPRRIRRGIGKGDLLWGTLDHSRVLQILHNPHYTGAFVYGRTHGGRTAELRTVTRKVPREDWKVMFPEAHIGYINWEEYERNQAILQRNSAGFGNGKRGSVPRVGADEGAVPLAT